MKAKFKGIIKKAFQVQQYGQTKIVKLEVLEPPRLDEFGEPIGKPQTHLISVINSAIERCLPEAVKEAVKMNDVNIEDGGKCELTVYINSRTFEHEGETIHRTELAAAEITFI